MTLAEQLIGSGYRGLSNRFRMVSRIDRPDWREHMAQTHSPWSLEQGREWVVALGPMAADYYRRCLSKDRILDLDPAIYMQIKRAGLCGGHGDLTDYLPLIPTCS